MATLPERPQAPGAEQPGMSAGGSITRRLRIGLAVFALALAATAGLTVAAVSRQDETLGEQTTRVQPLQAANIQLREEFARSQAGLYGYLLTGQKRFLDVYRDARAELTGSLAQIRRLAPGELAGAAETQARAAQSWYKIIDQSAAVPWGSRAAVRLTEQDTPAAAAFYRANGQLQQRAGAWARRVTRDSRRSLEASLAWSGGFLAVVVALALVVPVVTTRRIARPLRALTATLRQLTAGDHAARAQVAGAPEVQAAARSVNALADEADRLRREEQEHARLRAMARDAGNRIREELKPADVIRAAHATIEQNMDCDLAFVHLVSKGRMGSPECHERDLPVPAGFLSVLPDDAVEWGTDLLKRGASMVVQELDGPDGDAVPPLVREALLRLGVTSHIVTPFGIGSELLGLLAGERTRRGHPWTAAEIDAFESIAADVGRGLNHARLYEAENRLVADLKALDRARTDFLATVSHELRTPLTSIAGYVELLKEGDAGPLTADQNRMLDTIDRNAALLRNLIEDVLMLSRIELGPPAARKESVDLTEAISAAVTAIQPVAEAGEVVLTSECHERSLMVNGDASQLDRVLMNLLSNAVKFTPASGTVTVTATYADGWAVVSVRDTGIGIPERDKKDLFSRFFRASNVVARSFPGTGLGLSISRTIVTAHGGEVHLQSREGTGTTVTVRIPLQSAQEPREAAARGQRR